MTEIHFLASYVCLKGFLSLYKKNINNIVICSKKDIYDFLSGLLTDTEIFFLEDSIKLKVIRYQLNQIKSKLYSKTNNRQVTIKYYCNKYSIGYFILINNLRDYYSILFYDCEPKNLYSMTKNILDVQHIKASAKKLFIYLLHRIELQIVYHQNGTYIYSYDKDKDLYDTIELLDWENILFKFNCRKIIAAEKNIPSVLYIYQNLDNIKGINANISYNNIANCLAHLAQKGFKVFIKGHPSHQLKEAFNKNADYTILPSFIPVELFEANFSLYLTVFSLGIRPFIDKGNAYSLYQFISITRKNNLKEIIEMQLNGIKYLSYSDIENITTDMIG